jgi:hypothetical protein
MDLGDWQELSRLRFENHLWHRWVAEILETMQRPGARADSIADNVESSTAALNEQLVRLHRRPVTGPWQTARVA